MIDGSSASTTKKRLINLFHENKLVERLEKDDVGLSFTNTDYLFWRMSLWCMENQKATFWEEKRP
ncbi:hypothetical protein I6N95_15965 [Vagococcus sp. BWB3-3]|uniref:Uncharacterized protein n=1 Tax=Vagococcus allomyrinae TaxID=2794353 RepID=A0A940P7J2_9ENTE|nr:hypothetical protein [Vagococcus allomyrinae]MBP1042515.1 hypothetical protein [Vagococcus allomyrinae]